MKSLRNLGLAALLSLASPTVQSCGSEQAEEETVDTVVQTAWTNSQGIASFNGIDPITVVDASDNPLAGVKVNAYDLESGDAYLAEGGVAAFPAVEQLENTLHQYLQNRTLVVRPSEGLTFFDRNSEEVVFDLMRWTIGNEYSCDGMYTTEQLIEQRDNTAQLVSYFDPTGKVEFVYDTISYLIDAGIVDDLPAGKNWFVLSPVNPTATRSESVV